QRVLRSPPRPFWRCDRPRHQFAGLARADGFATHGRRRSRRVLEYLDRRQQETGIQRRRTRVGRPRLECAVRLDTLLRMLAYPYSPHRLRRGPLLRSVRDRLAPGHAGALRRHRPRPADAPMWRRQSFLHRSDSSRRGEEHATFFERDPPVTPFRLLIAVSLALLPACAQMPSDGVELVQQCAGPLGALVPECQTARSALESGAPVKRLPAGISLPENLKSVAPKTAAGGPDKSEPPAPAPPQPPTEFQRFAASSVGRVLPIFGAGLFEHVPTTFAPVDRVPVTADYVVGPGDEVLVRAW